MLDDKWVGVWGRSALQGERYLPPALVFCLVPPSGQDGNITTDSPPIPFPAKRLFQAVSKRVAGTVKPKPSWQEGCLESAQRVGRLRSSARSHHLLGPAGAWLSRVLLCGGRRQMDRNDPRLLPGPTSKCKEEKAVLSLFSSEVPEAETILNFFPSSPPPLEVWRWRDWEDTGIC